jgi:hypothetical protein
MRKIVYLLILGILLTGCNFPLLQTQVPADVVATQVAQFLTQTAVAIPPSETPSLNQSTPTIQGTQTITPTITPTLGDPSASLGNPYWSGGLNSGVAFGLSTPYSDSNSEISLQNGKMILTSLIASGWRNWRLTDRGLSDYYLEAFFKTQSCSGLDQYGLVFHAPDYGSGQGYYFIVTCNGQFGLLKWNSSNQSYILALNTNSNILPGSNQTNKLGVYLKGNSIRLYLNGKQVFETTDATFQSATKLGTFIATVSTPGFTVEMSNIQLWNVP